MTVVCEISVEPFATIEHKLEALSPRVLDRGYSLAFKSDGHLLTGASTPPIARSASTGTPQL